VQHIRAMPRRYLCGYRNAGLCEATVNFDDPTFSGTCPPVTLAQTEGLPSGSAFPEGINLIEFTATDGNGNEATCGFNIIVEDNEAPTIECPDDIAVSG
jgi:hypothetical protein